MLTNAIYFKGDWQAPFDKAQTKEEDFQTHPKVQSITMLLMHRVVQI